MARTTVEFRNQFHNTSATATVDHRGRLSATAYRRIKRELCGLSDCRCINPATAWIGDTRMHMVDDLDENGKRVLYIER